MNKKGRMEVSDWLEVLKIIIIIVIGYIIIKALLGIDTNTEQCAVSYVKDNIIYMRWIDC